MLSQDTQDTTSVASFPLQTSSSEVITLSRLSCLDPGSFHHAELAVHTGT